MRRKNKKLMLSVVIVLVLSIAMATVVFAADYYDKTLKAAFRNIKIFRNGQQVQLNLQKGALEPFIVDGTTYVPLRAISEMLDKEVSWDQANYAVHINDKQGQTNDPQVLYLMSLLTERDAEIANLKDKIAKLEAELESKKMDLDDLEDELNKKFYKYKKIKFDIEVSGDEDDIEVEIYFDLDDYWDEWHDLDEDDIEEYIEDIVDYIEDNFKDASIYGFIEDDPYNDILVEFEVNSKGKLIVDFDGIDDDDDDKDLGALEKDLNKKYNEIDDVDVEVELDWDKKDIEASIWIDYDEFYDLSNKKIKSYLNDIYDKIEKEFKDVVVYGYFISDDKYEDELLYFEFDSDGDLVEYEELDA